MTDDTSRRDVLQRIGTGVGGLALATGSAAAAQSDRYIVGTSSPAATAAAKRSASTVLRELDFGEIGQAVAGEFPAEARRGLQRRRDVRYVEPDAVVRAIAQTVPWGVDRVDADEAHATGETGGDSDDGDGGADIAVIDTGIDDDHPDLDGNIGTGRAFVDCQGTNCTYAWSDDNNHGTHCSGIANAEDNDEGVLGVSTAATLHAAKVLDEDGAGYASDVAAGIEWVANQGYDVGSMSLGTSSSISTIADACQYADGEGVLLVAAAGNDGGCSDCVSYPAAYDTVVAVSATTSEDTLASFSSTGPEVELAAPGASVYSSVIGGYNSFSGTSMACPHVSGAGAQLMDNGYSNTEARARLTETAEDIGLPSNEQGAGLLDVEAALASPTGESPSVSWTAPGDGEIVDGEITVQVAADDDKDGGEDLTVEWQRDGEGWQATTFDSSSGSYQDTWDTTATGDGDHVLDARATDTGGNVSSEASISVTVSNTSTSPTIDSYTVTEAGSPNPHATITADWTVSDADGDLDTVFVDVFDAGTGSLVDSSSQDVSGASAAGSETFEIKHSRKRTFDVNLTVTDAGGNTATATQTVSE